MKEKMTKFFETELHYLKVDLDREDDAQYRSDTCWYARQRALGAVSMAQMCGLDDDTAEKMFYDYCAKLDEMEHEVQLG